MDLVAACRVFVHVAERGSFTDGAAAARVPQSVASRRVAALEEHFGERVFDRSTRRPALTAFGRDMLASAKRLVQLADEMQLDAGQARLRPLTLAVPEICATRDLAVLDAAARDHGSALEFRAAPPVGRLELSQSRQVRAAITAVPASEARWVVPLGVAARSKGSSTGFRIESLRPSRADPSLRRLWLQPEDDVAHLRGEAERAGHRSGLVPAQIVTTRSLTAAVVEPLRTHDLLLCSQAQAAALDLHWRPLRDPALARGYVVVAAIADDAVRVSEQLWSEVARCLGDPEHRKQRTSGTAAKSSKASPGRPGR